ncbi:MAG: glycoside hydrolase family 9 protein [Oscillospiraceae bacterium]|nr:glycoside hydrolase family 9 protein [Oscillospiraceae bacterium]
MNLKKIIAGISSLAMLATAIPAVTGDKTGTINANAADSKYNYAEALQKSMFFYQVQQAGKLPDWNQVSWRADSVENDVVDGGWFDAGDHLKFSLTNAYTASVMAWGIIEYKDAVKKAGLYDLYLKNLQWGLDFVAGCDKGDKVIGTIGDDAFDHVWWGSAEMYMRKFTLKGGSDPRPYDEITCTSTVAQMSAAMAAGYIVFKDENPELAESYLKHAKSLFKLANDTKSNDDQGVQKKYYNAAQSGNANDYADELLYASNWLYKATGEQSYLDLAETYLPDLGRENQSTDYKYTWGFCWDDTMQGALLLYAQNTGKKEWIDHVSHHLEYWIDGYNGKKINYTPDGLAWCMNWGSLRHAENTAFIAMIAADTIFKDDAKLSDRYNNWAKSQMDYAFGDNNLGMSYVVGMGEKNPVNIHHRTASGAHDDHWNELGKLNEDGTPYQDPKWQTEYAHVLYGALEGGPSMDGSFKDENASYEHTEVAIDYNAGFTAALCAMIDDYGGEILENFPPTEQPKWAEFFMKASFNQATESYTEIKAYAMNHSAWPARVIQDLSYNYYFDISELVEQGFSIDDVQVTKGTDQHSGDEGVATVSEPIHYKDNIYYVKITFGDGRVVMPTGQSEHRSELQFRIGIPDNLKDASGNKPKWDSTNDYSAEGLVQGGEDDMIETSYITMYDGDTLIWGVEPDGTKADPTVATKPTGSVKPTDSTNSTDSKILWGDANDDGTVDVADVVASAAYVGDPNNNKLPGNGLRNSDVHSNGNGITADDALAIQQYLAKIVKSLPIG